MSSAAARTQSVMLTCCRTHYSCTTSSQCWYQIRYRRCPLPHAWLNALLRRDRFIRQQTLKYETELSSVFVTVSASVPAISESTASYSLQALLACFAALQGRRWVFESRGSNFEGAWGDVARSRGRAPGAGQGAKSPEAEEILQIVHVRKVFFVYNTWYQSEHIDYVLL